MKKENPKLNLLKKIVSHGKPLAKVKPVETTFVKGLDQPDFLIIPQNALTMLAGAGGIGKSFIAIHLAIRYVLANPEKKALLWLSEDLEGHVAGRFKALWFSYYQDKYKKDFGATHRITTIGSDTGVYDLDGLNSKEIKELFADFDFIVLDPLISFAPSGVETDNQEARRFMARLMSLAKEKDGVVIIHHVSKTTADEIAKGTATYVSGRGSSDITNAMRLIYVIHGQSQKEEKEEDEQLTIDENTQRIATIAKDNWGVSREIGTERLTITIFPPASKSKSKNSK